MNTISVNIAQSIRGDTEHLLCSEFGNMKQMKNMYKGNQCNEYSPQVGVYKVCQILHKSFKNDFFIYCAVVLNLLVTQIHCSAPK